MMPISEADTFLKELAAAPPPEIHHAGRVFRAGQRVVLKPAAGGDPFDAALDGCTALVEGIEQDDRGNFLVAVIPDADRGADLAATRHPAHRFLFSPAELELLPGDESRPRRILIAGIGNLFLGDDGFGCAVAGRLAKRELPPGVEACDFGIRGIDLAYALGRAYAGAILIDALPPAGAPGRIAVLEPRVEPEAAARFDSHRMEPVALLSAAARMSSLPPRVLLVGCEAASIPDDDDLRMELSGPVAAAVDRAAGLALDLARELQVTSSK